MARKKDQPEAQPAEPEAEVQAAGEPEAEVQAAVDAEEELGYRGDKTDPAPNEAYTVGGVTSGAPTPETDAGLAQEAEDAAGMNAARARVDGDYAAGPDAAGTERE